MRAKRMISLWMSICMLLLTGCGDAMTADALSEAAERAIELDEPIIPVANVLAEEAAIRDIYIADVYQASVFPEVSEYSFGTNQRFEAFEKFYGDEVKSGDVLVQADSEKVDAEVEKCQEHLDKLNEEYREYVQETEETITKAKWWMAYYADILDDMQNSKPADESATDYASRMAAWEKENTKWQGEYNWQEFLVYTGEEGLRQKKIIYDIDVEYYTKELQKALKKQRDAQIVADVSGTVVGVRHPELGEILRAGSPVIAVAKDKGTKYIKCDYIYRLDVIYNSKDVYAFIHGNRFELTYVDDGNEETTTFILQEKPGMSPDVGDFANIVLERRTSREQVVTVPKEAIYGTVLEYYVYVIEDGKPVKTIVKPGSSDGVYTEIISGVEAGDLVQIPVETVVKGSEEQKLELGESVRKYSGVALEYYVSEIKIKSPFPNVNVYFEKYLVSHGQHVWKGDPIARIRVEGSTQEIYELEMEIQRDKERLQDTIDLKDEDLTEDAEEDFRESVALTRESIEKKEIYLAELKKAFSTTVLTAPEEGFIKELKWFPGESLVMPDDVIAVLCNTDRLYLTVNDNFDHIKMDDYAMSNIYRRIVHDKGYKQNNVGGWVSSLENHGLSKELQNDKTFIRVKDNINTFGTDDFPKTDVDQLRQFLIDKSSGYADTIKVDITNRTMQGAIMVPKQAVTVVDGATYVNVVQPDGTVKRVSFIAGGNSKVDEYYWSIKGLAEGMIVCWE